MNVCHKRTINSGRKKVELDLDKFSQIPFARRTTLRDLSFALDINKTSLLGLKKMERSSVTQILLSRF